MQQFAVHSSPLRLRESLLLREPVLLLEPAHRAAERVDLQLYSPSLEPVGRRELDWSCSTVAGCFGRPARPGLPRWFPLLEGLSEWPGQMTRQLLSS